MKKVVFEGSVHVTMNYASSSYRLYLPEDCPYSKYTVFSLKKLLKDFEGKKIRVVVEEIGVARIRKNRRD